MKNKPAIGITMGDPSGVGAEVIAKSIQDPKITNLGKIVIIGDTFIFSKVSRLIPKQIEFIDTLGGAQTPPFRAGKECTALPSFHSGLSPSLFARDGERKANQKDTETKSKCSINPEPFDKLRANGEFIEPEQTTGFSPWCVEWVDLNNVSRKDFSFGKIRPEYGRAAMQCLDFAMKLIKERKIDCLVTAPISKEAINLAGYHFSGHTEYLKTETKSRDIAMMFSTPNLKVTLVTRHSSLKKAIAQLSIEKIFSAVALTHNSLHKQFKIKNPHIGVCGINPHAGEAGLLGEEETRIISPAVKKANKKFKNIFGPIAADTIFYQALNGKFDAVIAMYHDQALIPVKTLFSDLAVNITLGLPFVRTSPIHGTAFDIAGKNIANPSSMKEAIKLAIYLCQK